MLISMEKYVKTRKCNWHVFKSELTRQSVLFRNSSMYKSSLRYMFMNNQRNVFRSTILDMSLAVFCNLQNMPELQSDTNLKFYVKLRYFKIQNWLADAEQVKELNDFQLNVSKRDEDSFDPNSALMNGILGASLPQKLNMTKIKNSLHLWNSDLISPFIFQMNI